MSIPSSREYYQPNPNPKLKLKPILNPILNPPPRPGRLSPVLMSAFSQSQIIIILLEGLNQLGLSQIRHQMFRIHYHPAQRLGK